MIENRTTEVVFSIELLPQKIKRLFHTLTSDGKYGSSDRYYTMYLWSIPFVTVGCLFSILQSLKDLKNKHLSWDACIIFVAVGEVIMFVLCGLYNYHINGIFIVLGYFCIYGILHIFLLIKKNYLRIGFVAVLSSLYLFSFIGFVREYFYTEEGAVYQVYAGVDEAVSLLADKQKGRDVYVLDEVAEFYFLSNPISPAEFSSHCDELGYIKDYKNLHFYEPNEYAKDHVYICTKTSGRHYALLDSSLTGHEYDCMETEHYYVIY
jgi:hypothetical protein